VSCCVVSLIIVLMLPNFSSIVLSVTSSSSTFSSF
jgi:hypothetical protein